MKQDISFHYTYIFFNIIATNMIFQNKNDLPNNKLNGYRYSVLFSSVAQLYPTVCDHSIVHCPLSTPRIHQNSCPLSQWCHPTISSSVVPFSSCPQSFPASGYFQMSQLFTWGGQNISFSFSVSPFPMNTQDWFPLGWTGSISLQSKGLSRVFSNTTVQKHQFFCAQLSL